MKERGKISFGKRHTIYSIKDGQGCADHDRSHGETLGPEEYTLIKLRVLELPEPLKEFEGRAVFLVAATLRPETMYGQTNCFVLPEGEYGLFEMKGDELFVCSERSAKNMAYQEMTPEFGKWTCLKKVKGADLIGVPLKAPLTKYERVYTLPLITISMNKGTGVVTSVPSDAPDDWAALRDFQTKQKWRDDYGVKEEWVKGFEPIPVLEIPGIGNLSAVTLVDELKIQSQKDKQKLTEAKEKVYKKGFFEGKMIIGQCEGQPVKDAKPIVRALMIDAGDAAAYFEPEGRVVSRSGDECIVALCDQWFLNYGEPEWRA